MRTLHWTTLPFAMALAAVGCDKSGTNAGSDSAEGVDAQEEGDDGATAGTATDGSPPGEGDNGGVTTNAPPDDADDDTAGNDDDEPVPEPPVLFDLGTLPDAPSQDTACRKVDFLFVIDNSGSMFTYQQELVNNFPVFIEGIQSSLDSVMSYQVGVTTTDAYSYNAPGCNSLSSLVVQTGGGGSSNGTCGPYDGGDNFMTEMDDLAQSFSCAAQVGTSGNAYELPMRAVEEAVQRVDGGPGQCNEGFIRDDALLVIVIITDEAEGPGDPEGLPPTNSSAGTPDSWFQTVVDAKQGLAENVVVLSLINYMGGACPPSSPSFDGQNIADFTLMFGDNGFLGGICEIDYGPIFDEAIGVIDEACENFVPIE